MSVRGHAHPPWTWPQGTFSRAVAIVSYLVTVDVFWLVNRWQRGAGLAEFFV